EENGKTILHVLQGDFSVMPEGEKYCQMSEQIWDGVLPKMKELAESAKKTEQTCGTGLAENSALPAKLSELISSLADNLETHIKALDLQDENARKERDAYEMLVRDNRRIADQLQTTANQMAGCRDLPMGSHDDDAMSDFAVFRAFERFVTVKQELVHLL